MFRQENPVLLSGMKFYVYESMPPSVPPAVQRSRVVMKLEASALPWTGGQGDEGQQGEVEEAARRAPEVFAGFHHFAHEKAGQEAGDEVYGGDA